VRFAVAVTAFPMCEQTTEMVLSIVIRLVVLMVTENVRTRAPDWAWRAMG